MDLIESGIFGLIGITLGIIVGLLLGFWTNIIWRGNFMRNSLKKEMFLFRVLSKDKRSMTEFLVDIRNSVHIFKDKAIFADKQRIWRTSIKNVSLDPLHFEYTLKTNKDAITGQEIPISKDDGFDINQTDNMNKIKWEQGLPVLYIDEDNFRPIDFYPDKEEIPSDQIANAINNTINVEVARKNANKKNDNIMMLVVIGVVLISAYISFTTESKVNANSIKIDNLVVQVESMRNIIDPVQDVSQGYEKPNITDGRLVIRQ